MSQNPWDVFDVSDFNGVEVFWVETASFVVCPGEGSIVSADNPFSEFNFFGKQEALSKVHPITVFFSESSSHWGQGGSYPAGKLRVF